MGTPAEALAIVEEHLAWARTVASIYASQKGLPSWVAEDVEQNAMLGLIDAAGRFDPSRGKLFRTYAYGRVLGAIRDGARDEDWMSRADRWAQKRGEDFITTTRPERLGGNVELPMPSVRSYSSHIDWDETTDPLLALVDENAPDPEDETQKAEQVSRLVEAIQALSEREHLVITLYYYEGLTLAVIGDYLGVTESRVSQMHTKALSRLRARLGRELARAA